EKRRGQNAALSIAAVAIVIGIPLWWKTTETYRAGLPYSQISQLDSLQVLSVGAGLRAGRIPLSSEPGCFVFETYSKPSISQLDRKTSLKYHYEIKYRTATVMEEDALELPTAKEADLSLFQLSESPCGSVVVYVIPESSPLLPEGINVYVGQRRTALLRARPGRAGGLPEVLQALSPEVERVVQTMSFTDADIKAALSDRVPIGRLSRESLADRMRAFKSSPGRGLFKRLSSMYIICSPSFSSSPGSNAASSYPVLNFLLYVPDPPHSPLYIRDRSGREVPTNAFHSPRWGGIMVYNVREQQVEEPQFPVHVDIDMVRVMGVFLAQLRLLLGVQQVHAPPGYLLQSPGNKGLTDWELDRLLWARAVENIATATTTLTSLAQLLDEIGNIVIDDHIAEQVYGAVSSLQLAVAELEAGNLAFAFQSSKEAILSSERAFFDPSLLHLLYFPDDQKFAIYIPLFLPMSVPILLSLLKIGKEYRQSRAQRPKRD
uniref:Phosphatidylinositol glycan anchor biosynthesis, class S n=1 Tax=Lepisosteus oculatus TaxID=7918 RepID=W5MFV4_LEPOC